VCFAAALAAPADKQKREILPGDPRYGTDYHHHHHHHEHDNDVQISKAAGGYVSSITIPEETKGHSLQVQPLSSYGPNYNPIDSDYAASSKIEKYLKFTKDSAFQDSTKPSSGFAGFSSKLSSGFSSGFDSQTVDKPITTCATCSINSTHIINKHKEHVQPTDANGVQHLSVSSLPSYTSSISSFPSYFYSSYPSYPSYASYSNIPVKTVDHHVHVQVPQPYPVPVTKHVAYPVPVPHAVDVPKPYYVRVAQPVQVTVNRPYAVEVPRPVPYPIPQYVRSNIPVVQQQHIATLDATKAYPFEGFIENAQSTFQNVIGNLPSLQNPFENFQNPFQNFGPLSLGQGLGSSYLDSSNLGYSYLGSSNLGSSNLGSTNLQLPDSAYNKQKFSKFLGDNARTSKN
ncbi:chorion protein s38, partial [Lasius niger]